MMIEKKSCRYSVSGKYFTHKSLGLSISVSFYSRTFCSLDAKESMSQLDVADTTISKGLQLMT